MFFEIFKTRMERFPKEVQILIFEFDRTKREKMDKVVHQINFIPVLQNILEWAVRCYVPIEGVKWYSPLFRPVQRGQISDKSEVCRKNTRELLGYLYR